MTATNQSSMFATWRQAFDRRRSVRRRIIANLLPIAAVGWISSLWHMDLSSLLSLVGAIVTTVIVVAVADSPTHPDLPDWTHPNNEMRSMRLCLAWGAVGLVFFGHIAHCFLDRAFIPYPVFFLGCFALGPCTGLGMRALVDAPVRAPNRSSDPPVSDPPGARPEAARVPAAAPAAATLVCEPPRCVSQPDPNGGRDGAPDAISPATVLHVRNGAAGVAGDGAPPK